MDTINRRTCPTHLPKRYFSFAELTSKFKDKMKAPVQKALHVVSEEERGGKNMEIPLWLRDQDGTRSMSVDCLGTAIGR